MQVRATALGYYRWLRRVGEEFDIPESLHEPSWQEKVDASVPATPAPAAEPVREPEPADIDYASITRIRA